MEEKTRRAEKTKVTRGQVVLAVIILLFTILCFLPVALVLVRCEHRRARLYVLPVQLVDGRV